MVDTLRITGTNVQITDASGNVVYYPPPDPNPQPPTEKPKLAITTVGGPANTTTPVTIEGTIDLPNLGCDILLDAGPTSFGTTKANADGRWSKTVTLNAVGTWTLTAHATNSVGKTDSNSVIFQVTAGSGGGGGGGGSTDDAPQPQTRISSGSSLSAINTAIANCPAGGSVVLAAGSYTLGGNIRLKQGAVLWADGAATLVNGQIDGSGLSGWTVGGKAPGQGFVMNGLINATSASSFVIACATFNNLPSNGFDGSVVRLGSARNGVVVNCDFNHCDGNNLGMYNMDSIVCDGNHFADCKQPISYQFATDGSNGNNMQVVRSVFVRTTRACMEMGPDATKKQKMNGLKVNDNFFDDMNPSQQTNDQGASLPISLVATAATNSECKRNFVRRGSRPLAVARDHPAIEFSGSGDCTENVIDSFKWEGFAYSTGYHYFGNKAYNAPWGFVVGQGGGAGTIEKSQILTSPPTAPPWPTRIAQSQYYPWNKT